MATQLFVEGMCELNKTLIKYENETKTNDNNCEIVSILNDIENMLNRNPIKCDIIIKRIFILFTSGLDNKTNKKWCPDCVDADPIIKKNLNLLNQTDLLIICSVGERIFWKNKNNIFRTDKRFELESIPTLLQYKTKKKLIEGQCCKENLVKMIFDDDDD